MARPKPTPKPKLHVTVVVPDYAVEDFVRQAYSCWIIGHPDESKIAEKVVLALYEEYRTSLDNPEAADALEFFSWLESDHGYVVFDNTAYGWIKLPMNAGDDEPESATATLCEECSKMIPDLPIEGGLVNKHHDPSCSLYDPDLE